MKKVLMSLLAVLLTLAMVLSLAACGEDSKKKRKSSKDDDEDEKESTSDVGDTDQEDDDDTDDDDTDDDNKDSDKRDPAAAVIGRWKYTADMSEFVNLIYGTALGISVSNSRWEYVVYFTFKEDGTYTSEVDTDALMAGAGPFVEDMLSAIADMMGMDADTLLSMQGMSFEEYKQQMVDSLASSMTVGSTTGSGTYVVKDGTIALDDSGPSDFTIKGDVMTVQVPEGFREDALDQLGGDSLAGMIDVDSLLDSMIDIFYPMKLTRVK